MKQAQPAVENLPVWDDADRPWRSLLGPSHARLCLDALDFSDLWDEEDDDNEDEGTVESPVCAGAPPAPPPLPPPPPPPPTTSTKGAKSAKPGTLKLHWREMASLAPLPRMTRFGTQTIWASLEPVRLDTNRLQVLFESKGGSACFNLASGRRPCVSVLGMKRSNIVAIALSGLPPPRLLPPAILSMDSGVLDREDIQRLQALNPTEEELSLIRDAKAQNPHATLGQAELCLLTLGEIPHLSPRLQLWAFALDFDSLEREIAEPLFHLKLAMEQLAASQTFRRILATVLAIGNFLNGCKARGFELSYLGKLSQVRDTHSRQPLLQHVCVLLLQLYPQSSDLYSDIGAVTKAGKCDYALVRANLAQLEAQCKASWEQLKLLEKEDKKRGGKGERKSSAGNGGGAATGAGAALRHQLPGILKECEEKLKVLRAVHRRVINRFHSFLLFLGYSRAMVRDTKAEDFCRTIGGFALEYRAALQLVLQRRDGQQARAARQRRPSPARTQENEGSEEQCQLEEVLRTPESGLRPDATLPRHRRRTPVKRGPFSPKLKW